MSIVLLITWFPDQAISQLVLVSCRKDFDDSGQLEAVSHSLWCLLCFWFRRSLSQSPWSHSYVATLSMATLNSTQDHSHYHHHRILNSAYANRSTLIITSLFVASTSPFAAWSWDAHHEGTFGLSIQEFLLISPSGFLPSSTARKSKGLRKNSPDRVVSPWFCF